MRLADDGRGRVPFALVGVVLLVASATVATTLSTREPVPTDRRAELAVEAATAAARTALAGAVERAGREAARRPVLVPADTAYGSVLDDSSPFRDSLRVRVYLAARDALRRTGTTVDGVEARATLPPVTDPASLRAAMERVRLAALDGEPPRLAVTLRNVTVSVRRDGREVARHRYAPTVVVRTPVLALHRRVAAFERALDAGALAGDGLARRLTARLYPAAWARGYAQHGGAPVANVVANRHVEVAANGALLDLQRETLGRSDRAGRAAMLRATARVGLTDLGAGLRNAAESWQDEVLDGNGSHRRVPPVAPALASDDGWQERAADAFTVGADGAADRALDDLLAGRDGPSLSDVVADVYAADVRLLSRVRVVSRERDGGRPPPGATALGESSGTERVVRPGPAEPPDAPAGFHRLASYGRVVVTERRTVHRYRLDNRTRRVASTVRTVHRVGLAIVGRHAATDLAPERGIAAVHEPGGPLDGPNLADVRRRAVERLVTATGGPDALARRAVAGSLDEGTATVRGATPDGIEDWLAADLTGLRNRVGNRSTRVPVREVAVAANPAAALDDALRAERPALLDAPATYGSVAAKARVAARAALLDRLGARLRERAAASRSVRDRFERALRRAGVEPDLLAAGPGSARRSGTGPEPDPGPVVAVDGSPPYLTLSAVTAERVPAAAGRYHPLVARNLNVFTVPYGDVADAVAGGLGGPDDRVSLHTAGLTLQGVERTLADAANRSREEAANRSLRERRDRLRSATGESIAHVAARLRAALRANPRLGAGDRRAAVRAALDRRPTTHARALAAANGSLAEDVAAEATARLPGAPAVERERLRVRLRSAIGRALREPPARPPESAVRPATAAGRSAVREGLAEVAGVESARAVERLRRELRGPLGAVAAGLPVLPVPGWWYATVNVWHVAVRGEYARVAVRAGGGSPVRGADGTVAYVRRAGPVSLDVDGDGTADELGRTTPVSFEAETTVVVVVPPGRGVGDLAGNADERSPGWPAPWEAT